MMDQLTANLRANAEMLISVEALDHILDLPRSYQVVGAATPTSDDERARVVRLLVDAGDLAIPVGDRPHLISVIHEKHDHQRSRLKEIRTTLAPERQDIYVHDRAERVARVQQRVNEWFAETPQRPIRDLVLSCIAEELGL